MQFFQSWRQRYPIRAKKPSDLKDKTNGAGNSFPAPPVAALLFYGWGNLPAAPACKPMASFSLYIVESGV